MVFEFRAPLKDDRTSIVLTFTKEHCARFETRCRSHCCRRIFKNVTIVDVFGREKLNTPPPPPENVYFHFKVHFRILLPVVSFDIRRYTKRRQTIFLLLFFFSFFFFSPLFFQERYRTEISIYAWMCEQFYREVRSAHKSISTVDLIAPTLKCMNRDSSLSVVFQKLFSRIVVWFRRSIYCAYLQS